MGDTFEIKAGITLAHTKKLGSEFSSLGFQMSPNLEVLVKSNKDENTSVNN